MQDHMQGRIEKANRRDKTQFLELGDIVVARTRVYDLPGQPDPGLIHAEAGEEGMVVHTEPGCWPTVRFTRTKTATMVTDQEVKLK